MFNFAILIGIYAYILFFLGIINLLHKEVVNTVSIIFVFSISLFFRRNIVLTLENIKRTKVHLRSHKLSVIIAALLMFIAVVNVIGALGPELAFDALWYHLTLPKLYLLHHAIEYIPGGLLYYSVMPKLGEMLYVGALALGDEITVKVLHWIFGILTSIVIYNIARKFFNQTFSLLAVLIFYSNLVVAWESITAYVDLIRTFFETLALAAFVNWWRLKNDKWLILSAIMLGLAITTKLLAIGSFIMFFVLISIRLVRNRVRIYSILSKLTFFTLLTFLIPLPWLIFSFLHTSNPVYPFFTPIYGVSPSHPNPINFIADIVHILLFSPDPLTPLYILFIPLAIILFPKFSSEFKLLIGYSVLALIFWYFTPRTGGGRFIMPYLPAFSIICAACIYYFANTKELLLKKLSTFLIAIAIVIAVTTFGYRLLANMKYIPVIVGQETKAEFLKNNLNFSFGDFYDVDGYFAKTIKPQDKVLLFGFHNLYYIDFPYVHHSWVQRGERFNYIAIQDGDVPERFKQWQLIYENKTTNVKLYSDGGKIWRY